MTLKQTLEAFEALDSARACGRTVVELLARYPAVSVSVEEVRGGKGKTDFVKVVIAGTQGRLQGGTARTLGIVGRLGGLGARPRRIGLVSDGEGAVAAVAIALKLARMQAEGDPLPGDVIISTHICPDAPTRPHQPVEFMDSPISMEEMNAREVFPEMDALLSIDTTKGNRILNHRGFAISPTVKEGYILRVADDLVRIMETTTGRPAVTFPITMQDITPYGNDIYHLNSILQPSIATDAPGVGVAISAETVVPGSATVASHEIGIAAAVVLVTRLSDGSSVQLSAQKVHCALQGRLDALEADGCNIVLLLCTGAFEGLRLSRGFLLEPDRIIPAAVAGLIRDRQLGIIVPVASQITSESGKLKALQRPPILSASSPYTDTLDVVAADGVSLARRRAQALLLDL